MRSALRVAILSAFVLMLLLVLGTFSGRAAERAANLSGEWVLNRDLSGPRGELSMPEGGRGGRGAGGRTPGGGRGGGSGGGRRGGGIGGGGRPAGNPGAGRPSQEDMEQTRALLQEVMDLPARFTLMQDGDKVTFAEPDGVVRTYLANGKVEKHQLTHGTIETKTSWDGPSLRMQMTVGARGKLIRTFSLRDDPRRLEVSTAFDGAPKDARRVTVYDETKR